MSTLGKVFIILTALMFMFWALLLASVAEYNRNWSRKDAEQRRLLEGVSAGKDDEGKPVTAVSSLDEQYQDARDALAEKKVEYDNELMKNDQELTHRRTRIADGQKENAALVESLERYKIGVAAAKATEEQAKATLAQRTKERDDLQKTSDDTIAEVARAQDEHKRLLARLEELRKSFRETLAENRRLLKQFAAASDSDRRVRQAADAR
jgi:chromosome segregation ATPase